jgi:hypothetical protein
LSFLELYPKEVHTSEGGATRGLTALVYCDSYISAYIKEQYRLAGVHPTGVTVHQGCRRVSTGLPRSSGLGWKEKRSEVQPLWRCPLTG